jgi:hypothetical protein
MIIILILATLVAFFLFLLFNGTSSSSTKVSSTTTTTTSGGYKEENKTVQYRSSTTFRTIGDNYKTYEELQQALRDAGLESSNLIIGIDFTKSNTWTGKNTFNGECLHNISPLYMNPYQTVIRILGNTLAPFDDDNQIPCYGFGDSTTSDKRVFALEPNPCRGFQEILTSYSNTVPRIILSGPTSFAPLIYQAIQNVKQTGGYHILLIIADGQVTNEQDTIRAIVECSNYPISIVMIGVGDGPWDVMREFDDRLPQRKFDNFQFVPFYETMVKEKGNEILFARDVLMEIPEQFKAIKALKLL